MSQKLCILHPDGTVSACCKLPETIVCDPAGSTNCRCAVPSTAMACQVSIVYAQDRPHEPQILPMGPWCDAAGMELAVAVALARLLGAPKP